jgi:hypothetical protein
VANIALIKSKTKIDKQELIDVVISFFNQNFPKMVPEVTISENPDIALQFKFGDLVVPVWVIGKKVEMFSTGRIALSRTHTDEILVSYYDKIKSSLGTIPMSTAMDGYEFIFDTVKKVIAYKYSNGFILDDGIGKYKEPLENNMDFTAWIRRLRIKEEAGDKDSSMFSNFWANQPSLAEIERVQIEIWQNLVKTT